MATVKKASKRIIKCFCNCSELTKDEVKRIYRMSTKEVLSDSQASYLFRRFLEIERSGDKGLAEQYLDVYQKCSEYCVRDDIITRAELDELCDYGMDMDMERDLKRKFKTRDPQEIKLCLERIQGICSNKIEEEDEYTNYKQAILKKLKQFE